MFVKNQDCSNNIPSAKKNMNACKHSKLGDLSLETAFTLIYSYTYLYINIQIYIGHPTASPGK